MSYDSYCDRLVEERVFGILHRGLFEYHLDRNYAELPDTFVPSAEYVAIANWKLLAFADPMAFYAAGRRRPRRWTSHDYENQQDLSSLIDANDNFLLARQYGTDLDFRSASPNYSVLEMMEFFVSIPINKQCYNTFECVIS